MNSYSEKMLIAIKGEDLVEAHLMLEEALQNDSPELLESLGSELLFMGFLVEAQQIFEQLSSSFLFKDGAKIALAEIAIENNKIDQAFEYLESISPESESYVEALLVEADLYQLLEIPEVSEQKINKAKTILPDERLLDFALAELFFSTQQYSKALEVYTILEEIESEQFSDILIKERIGSIYSQIGEFEVSVPYFEEVLSYEETDDRLFQLAFVYIQIHENQKAIALLQKLRMLNPQYQGLYLPLGEVLLEEEILEEAQTILLEGIQQNPYQLELYFLASEVAYRLHDFKESEQLLLQAKILDEEGETVSLTLSNLYLVQNRFDEVLDLLSPLSDTNNPYILWNLANALNQTENYADAALFYEKAHLELEHEPDFLKEYAMFLREDGEFEQAKQMLLHYLKHIPDDLEVQGILEELF